MSQKPIAGYTTMQEEYGAGGPPPYGPPQPGYPPQQHQPTFQTTNTTVVVNQPVPLIMQQGMRDWSSGLCGCFEDCYSCCLGLFCPCILLCDVSSRMGEGCMFATCCAGALVGLRVKMRIQQNIQGSLCNDYCTIQCCGPCVLCQLSRELNHCGVGQ